MIHHTVSYIYVKLCLTLFRLRSYQISPHATLGSRHSMSYSYTQPPRCPRRSNSLSSSSVSSSSEYYKHRMSLNDSNIEMYGSWISVDLCRGRSSWLTGLPMVFSAYCQTPSSIFEALVFHFFLGSCYHGCYLLTRTYDYIVKLIPHDQRNAIQWAGFGIRTLPLFTHQARFAV